MFEVIGRNVREERISHGWSQRFVASQLNISHQSISRLENGHPVSSHLLKKVTGLLQVSLSDLYQEQKNNEKFKYRIPDDVMKRMILNSQPLVEAIYNESILRFKQELKRNSVLLNDDITQLIKEYFGERKSYNIKDLQYIGMLSNQKTLESIMTLS